jgi:predicted nucleotidyltransferase
MNSFGLEEKHLKIIKDAFRRFKLENQNLKVWIFGSRSTGTHKPFSDIDLLIEAAPAMTSSQQSEISSALEESNLPFKVDIVLLENLYPPYAPKIQTEKKLLFSLS